MSSPPLHAPPLRELIDCQNELPNINYAKLLDWRTYDLNRIIERSKALRGREEAIKPRIDVIPEITTKHNLSVKWYPTGYLEATPDWENHKSGFSLNDLKGWKFEEEPDFTYFAKESFEWGARPPNELMFIRGIGELYIEKEPWASRYDFSSIEEILVCIARATFNQLIDILRLTMKVRLRSDFVFE